MSRRPGNEIAFLALLLLPVSAWAQSGTSGTIAGAVRDTTGAILPGVTVEATSPALIEKTRSAVTDPQGNYKIIDLRPGVYRVTFTLPGFSTVARESLELNTGVTALVNAELKVGAVEETVTVSGATPVVDIQNVRTQMLLTREAFDALPTGKTMQAFTALTLGGRGTGADGGANIQDVGGSKGEGNAGFGVHGGRGTDQVMLQDGMYSSSLIGNGSAQNRFTYFNQAFLQETQLQTTGTSAEVETGGVQVNAIPKDGGNTFKVYVSGTGVGSGLQANNIDDALRARGLTSAAQVKKVYDISGGAGGALKEDRLWFYAAHRSTQAQEYVPGVYFNKTQGSFVYTPDPSRPAYTDRWARDYSVRLTWQLSATHKVAFAYTKQDNCLNCYNGVNSAAPLRAPEATLRQTTQPQLTQVIWSHPASNRLLLEAGATYSSNPVVTTLPSETTATAIPFWDLGTSLRYGAYGEGTLGGRTISSPKSSYTNQANQRFSMSYVTGSHAFKTGLMVQEGWEAVDSFPNNVPGLGPVLIQVRNGVPAAIQQTAAPVMLKAVLMPNLGIYAQDQWTLKRLTLNLGLRFDHLHEYSAPISIPGGVFVAAQSFPKVDNVPIWNDVNPRFGATYDLFGDGKTAAKVSIGRYVQIERIAVAEANAPSRALVQNVTRTWADTDADLFPDCVLTNPLSNGECGQINNLRFGTVAPNTTYDPNYIDGFGVRPSSWQTTAGVQHELRPGVGLAARYFRTWFVNFTSTDNLMTTPADFDPFCIAAPTDARLGSVSGTPLCGLYDVKAAKFGQVQNFVTLTSNYGHQSEVYNGFEVATNARFGKGGLLQGGVSSGRTVIDNCVVIDTPQAARPGYCRQVLPFKGQTQYKFSGVYPLPLDVQISGVYQNLPGAPISATVVVPNGQIAPSLGRDLAAGPNGTATIDLLPPNTVFENRLSQIDVRVTKIIRLGRARVQGMLDIYNLFNANTVLSTNTTYGPSWLLPVNVLGGRLFKFTGQLDF